MRTRLGRRLLTVAVGAAVAVLLAPASAYAVSGTIYLDLHNEGANWVSFRSRPSTDSAKAKAIGEENCDPSWYTVKVNVYVLDFDETNDRAKIRTIQLVMDKPGQDYHLVDAKTAYYPPGGDAAVSGPGLRGRVFPQGEYGVHVIDFEDRWVALDDESRTFRVDWTMRSENDSEGWCGVRIYAVYTRGTPSTGGGGGGGGGCAMADGTDPRDALPVDVPDKTLTEITDPVTMLVDTTVSEVLDEVPPLRSAGAGDGSVYVDAPEPCP